MMEQVEAGHVEAIIVKDMSRLGRDYLKVGQSMKKDGHSLLLEK